MPVKVAVSLMDSIVRWKFNYGKQDWLPEEKYIFRFDEKQRMQSRTILHFEKRWVNRERRTISWDGNDHLTIIRIEVWDGQKWTDSLKTLMSYNALNQKIKETKIVTGCLGGVKHFTYHKDGRLKHSGTEKEIDGKMEKMGDQYEFEYDRQGNIQTEYWNSFQMLISEYDSLYNRISLTDFRKNEEKWALTDVHYYDFERGMLKRRRLNGQRRDTLGGNSNPENVYEYNENNDLVSARSERMWKGKFRYLDQEVATFDQQHNRLKNLKQGTNNDGSWRTESCYYYTYDDYHNIISSMTEFAQGGKLAKTDSGHNYFRYKITGPRDTTGSSMTIFHQPMLFQTKLAFEETLKDARIIFRNPAGVPLIQLEHQTGSWFTFYYRVHPQSHALYADPGMYKIKVTDGDKVWRGEVMVSVF